MATRSKYGMLRVSKLALAVSLAFNGAAQAALPTGAQVASGSAQIGTVGNTMTVTNSPSAIINWQSFSIGQSEAVKFVQQSASSSVLNRVVGGQMSAIMGRLSSNGRVFLINPAGVLVGAGAVVDTASFFVSTLQILDKDFLTGKLQFQGDADSGKITNQGLIRTGYGGQVVLMAPNIENSGIIQAPGGKILLAAGQKVTLGSLDMDGLSFQVQAPTDSALNLGQLIADGGVVKVFAGSLKHSGDIRANSLTRDSGGEIVLKAGGDVELTAGSTTLANGRTGGTIRIESETGNARVAGDVSATGRTGAGGAIDVLGEKVVLAGNATLDASGATAGGVIRVGGDWQGANPDLKNAQTAFVGSGVTLKADATEQGDGGKIVVWSDGDTRFLGSLSAQGGPNGGNGGNAEVSGKGDLLFIGGANLGAPKGTAGSLLLDPLDLFVDAVGGLNPSIIDENTDFPDHAVTVAPATLAAIVGNVTLYASRDMRINSAIVLNGAGQGLAASAGRDMQIGAGITTNGGNVTLRALGTYVAPGAGAASGGNLTAFSASPIVTSGTLPQPDGSVTLEGKAISALNLTVAAGTGAVTATASAGSLSLGALFSAGSLTRNVTLAASGGDLSTSNITATGAVLLTGSGSVSASNIATGGGTMTANAAGSNISITSIDTRAGGGPTGGVISLVSTPSSVSTGNVQAGNASVSMSGTSVSTSTITTTGSVSLTASNGDISSTIDNAAAVTANATRTTNSDVSVNLLSNTTLNATSVSANTSFCSLTSSCRGATVNLSGAQGVNVVGTVSASAAATTNRAAPFNSITESVTIRSRNGAISAQSPSAQIRATDVSLFTGRANSFVNPVTVSGGGIGSLATPLRVDVKRKFEFGPNGEFNVQLNGAVNPQGVTPPLSGTGPVQLDIRLGVAAAGQTYKGTLSNVTNPGQITLSVDTPATPTTVTVDSFSVSSGFNDLVFNAGPSISLSVPNGSLVATSLAVPQGDQVGRAQPTFPFSNVIQGLPVSVSASQDLTIASYTRAAGSQAKASSFTATNGALVLGSVAASRDSVTASGSTGVTVNNLSTVGTVSVSSANGGIAMDSLSSSGSNVTLTANNGIVGAVNDGPGVEVTAAGSLSISANKIGAAGFTNPLDLAANSVSLTATSGAGTRIGSDATASNPVTAATTNLTLNTTGVFKVDTLGADLTNLTVTASPSGVGAGGTAQVTSNGRTYAFASDGTDFTLANWTAPAAQFAGGTLRFTSTAGDLTLNNIDFSASNGSLNVTTQQSGSGTITQIGSFDLGSGFLTMQADGAVTLANPTMGGLSAGNANSIFGTGCGVGGYSLCGVASFTAGNITDTTGFGSFSVSSRGAINTGNLEVGNVSFTAYTGGISTGTIGTAVRPANYVYLATGLYYGFGGSVQTGAIESYNTTIYADGNITIGTLVTPAAINAANPGAGSVYLYSYPGGNVTVGNIDATSTYVDVNGSGTITTGNINANAATTFPNDISLRSYAAVTTGALDANQISISSNCCGIRPSISVGAIGGNRPGTSVDLYGSDITVGGALSLDAGGSGQSLSVNAGGNLTINGNVSLGHGGSLGSPMRLEAGGILDINGGNGVITAVDGSFLQLNAGNTNTATPFQFASIGAGPTGGVTVNAPAGIRQTLASASGGGITAATVTLNADAAGSLIEGPTTLVDPLTVRGTTSLTVTTGGAVNIDRTDGANPIPLLTNVDISQSDATQAFSLTGYSGGQLVTIGYDGISGAQVAATTPSGAPMTFRYQNSGGASSDITGLGIATMNGSVILDSTSGNVSAGNIDTTDGGIGSQISISAGQALTVNGALNAGTGQVILSGSGIGGSGSVSAGDVRAEATAGDIGSSGTHLAISANSVDLTARKSGVGGDVFASLTGTNAVTLFADNGFTVATDTALTNLAITTRGDGVGPVALAAPGQAFGFARNGAALDIATVSSPTPLAKLGMSVTNGNLRVVGTGVSSVAADNLSLFTSGDFFLDGTGARLVLSSAGPQQFVATGNLSVTGAATFTSSGTQQFRANGDTVFQAQGGTILANAVDHVFVGRDIRLLGGATTGDAVTVAATGSQNFSATRHIDLLGGAGDNASVGVSLNGNGSQSLSTSGGGNITLAAGTGNASSVTLSASGAGRQDLYADGNLVLSGGGTLGANTDATVAITKAGSNTQRLDAGGSISLTGGAGDRGSVTVSNSGAGNQEIGDDYCCSNPTDNLTVQGGAGVDSFALVNAAGRQFIKPVVSLNVLGGGGTGAYARINTDATTSSSTSVSGGPQIIGYSNSFDCCSGDVIDTIALTAGGGTGAYAEISSAGSQRIAATTSLTLAGSAATGAFARLTALSQDIRTATTTLTAGAGNGANASIEATGTEANRPSGSSYLQLLDPSGLSLSGGGTVGANAATARIASGGTQRITSSPTTLLGGDGPNSSAEIVATTSQSLVLGNLTMTAGAGNNSSANIVAGTTQSLSASTTTLSGAAGQNAKARIEAGTDQTLAFGNSNVTLTGGTGQGAQAMFVADAGQTINNISTLTLTGGIVTGGGDAFALITNDSGVQTIGVNFGDINIRGGSGIVTFGSGQTVSTSGTIRIDTTLGANSISGTGPLSNGYYAGIRFAGSGAQTIGIGSGSIIINNANAPGPIGIVTPSTQVLNVSGAISVIANAGDARIDSGSTQTITASNGILTVQASGGSGTARINAPGAQTVVARAVDVNTQAAASGNAELFATGNQSIHTTNGVGNANGSLHVAALGSGTARVESGGSQLLEIDYPEVMQQSQFGARDGRITIGEAAGQGFSLVKAADNQDIFARSITIQGGNAADARSKLTAVNTQNISILLGGITVKGGSGDNAVAQIDPTLQTIVVNGPIDVTGGGGAFTINPALSPMFSASAGILATGPQTILSTSSANITITGGTGANAFAVIGTTGSMQALAATPGPLPADGLIVVNGGTGSNADAVFGANGGTAQSFFSFNNCTGLTGTCGLTAIQNDPFTNAATQTGVYFNPLAVPLAEITAATGGAVSESSTLGLPGLLFNSLILWDPTLPLTDEEREKIVLGRRLPVCN